VNIKEIIEMIKLMNENNLTEFEMEKEGERVHLKKESKQQMVTHIKEVMPHVELVPAAKEASKAGKEPQKNVIEIKAPMVGTFYRSPAPDATPFVEVGMDITVGQVVCIIEAMKLMNEIKSEVRGKVVDIPVDNAQPIEFGHTLFLIEPAQ